MVLSARTQRRARVAAETRKRTAADLCGSNGRHVLSKSPRTDLFALGSDRNVLAFTAPREKGKKALLNPFADHFSGRQRYRE